MSPHTIDVVLKKIDLLFWIADKEVAVVKPMPKKRPASDSAPNSSNDSHSSCEATPPKKPAPPALFLRYSWGFGYFSEKGKSQVYLLCIFSPLIRNQVHFEQEMVNRLENFESRIIEQVKTQLLQNPTQLVSCWFSSKGKLKTPCCATWSLSVFFCSLLSWGQYLLNWIYPLKRFLVHPVRVLTNLHQEMQSPRRKWSPISKVCRVHRDPALIFSMLWLIPLLFGHHNYAPNIQLENSVGSLQVCSPYDGLHKAPPTCWFLWEAPLLDGQGCLTTHFILFYFFPVFRDGSTMDKFLQEVTNSPLFKVRSKAKGKAFKSSAAPVKGFYHAVSSMMKSQKSNNLYTMEFFQDWKGHPVLLRVHRKLRVWNSSRNTVSTSERCIFFPILV